MSGRTRDNVSKKKLIILKIVIGIIVTFACFGIMHLISLIPNAGHGYSSSEEAVNKFVKAISEKDISSAKKCLYGNSSTYEDVIDRLSKFIDDNSYTLYLDSDKNSTTSETADEFLENNKDIPDAKKVIMHIYAKKGNVEKLSIYQIITCKIDDKWYVGNYDNSLDIMLTVPAEKTGTEYGADITGYLYADEWSCSYSSDNGKIADMKLQKQNSDITISVMDISTSVDNIIDGTKSVLEKTCYILATDDSSIAGIPAKRIVAYDPNNAKYRYFWAYKQPVLNNYAYLVELNTNEPEKTYSVISSYHTRKEK